MTFVEKQNKSHAHNRLFLNKISLSSSFSSCTIAIACVDVKFCLALLLIARILVGPRTLRVTLLCFAFKNMPFISKDWRSPGEVWVKTQEGWEKKKVLECTAQRYPAMTNFSNTEENAQKAWSQEGEDGETSSNESLPRIPPHCHITIKCTREIAGFNGLSEAVRRLDFSSAVRDVRRFNYICALLELLLRGQRLTHLPGAAQKLLLSMLEQLADQVATSQQNLNALRALLVSLSTVREAERRACWGRPLGSRALWGHHDHAIDRINRIADAIRIQEPGPEVVPKLLDLPEECIREILLRLSDHRDLDSASSACAVMSSVCAERRTWRELVAFHFTRTQTDDALHKLHPLHTPHPQDTQHVDWKNVFHHLRKMYGLREDAQYAETLSLCRHCKCLFWRSLGHPCIADQCPEYRERLREAGGPLPPSPVPPAAFLKFFSL